MYLNINQLRTFYAAAKSKNITLAAQELMVTPAAISAQVKQFEEALGVRLMFRDGHTMRLTEVGQNVFNKSSKIFELINEMEIFLQDTVMTKVGLLKIGCPQIPAKYIMPRLIKIFKKEYPGINIIIDEGDNIEMINNILTSKNELAVIRSKPKDKRLKVKVFTKEDLLLVCAPNSSKISTEEIPISQLLITPMIMPREGAATRATVFEFLQKFNVNPLVVIESGSVDFIKEMVKEDYGVAFLVRSAVAKELKAGDIKVVKVSEGLPVMEYGFGYISGKSFSPAAEAFIRLVDKLALNDKKLS